MSEIIINTDRLLLKGIHISDAEALFRYRSDPQIYEYQDWKPKTLEEVTDFITRNSANSPNTPNTWYQLGLYLKETKELIGDIGIHFMDPDNLLVEIGYTLAPQYQSKGYAFEAVTGVIDYLFYHLQKHRISASVDPRNERSIALLERMGMRKEAHFRKSLWFNNEWADDIVYAILQDEWKSGASYI